MSTIAVIPARYGSTRFPGKPLADETGKFLIQHVYEQVRRVSTLDRVIVATDDDRIASAVASFGGDCVRTRADHTTGTDRVAEVAQTLDCDIVLNIQGDEPEIEPEAIQTLIAVLEAGDCPMATLACGFNDLARCGIDADPHDPGCVKVVIARGRAIYFSRSLIPHPRNSIADYAGPYLHMGLYGYRREFLLKLGTIQPTSLERIEGLEQLRVLEHGHDIAVGLVDRAAVGIDTPEDYAAFVTRYARSLSKVAT